MSPLELDNDRLPGQAVQEGLGVQRHSRGGHFGVGSLKSARIQMTGSRNCASMVFEIGEIATLGSHPVITLRSLKTNVLWFIDSSSRLRHCGSMDSGRPSRYLSIYLSFYLGRQLFK